MREISAVGQNEEKKKNEKKRELSLELSLHIGCDSCAKNTEKNGLGIILSI